jgi:NAD(P)-dependent dehydrogenase (short-subunit alcohol dehydrogenase family)
LEIELKGRTAVITGASRGIGKEIATSLARAGCDIAVNDLDAQSLTDTVREVEALGHKAIRIPGDVSRLMDVEAGIAKALNELGHVDILINNAGIAMRKPFQDYAEEDWDRVLDTNLKGVFNYCHALSNHMIDRKQGKIISIASIMGDVALPPRAAYTASKGAIIALTKNLGAEWAKYSINVNAISPGWTETEMTKTYFAQPEVNKFLLERIPMGRFAKPSDIANVTVFLCSDFASYITGQNIFVDGGWTIQ